MFASVGSRVLSSVGCGFTSVGSRVLSFVGCGSQLCFGSIELACLSWRLCSAPFKVGPISLRKMSFSWLGVGFQYLLSCISRAQTVPEEVLRDMLAGTKIFLIASSTFQHRWI
jgi:hypothetical protein